MSFRFANRCLLCIASLLASACTETIIREVPANTEGSGLMSEQDSEPGGFDTVSDSIAPSSIPSLAPAQTPTNGTPAVPQSGLSSGGDPQTPHTPAIAPGDPLDPSQPIATVDPGSATPPGSFSDQTKPVVAGTPGMTADCQMMLPCRWSSDDGALSVTATSADNIAARGRLSVSFTLDTDHDTSVSLGTSPAAISDNDGSYLVTEQLLGAGNGNSPQPLLAGASLDGRLNYQSAAGAVLSSWSLALFDNGFARNAMFSNLPVGSAVNPDADCAGVLPCTWTTTDGDVTVCLLSAGGFAGSGRLTANFSIISNRDRTLAIDAASEATGNDGSTFTSRTHELGQQSGYQQLLHPTVAGASVPGSIDFFRSESQPTALRSLMLSVFDYQPSPRWNPIFLNVPVL